MICEACGFRMKVLYTHTSNNRTVRRYRCQNCGAYTYTVEQAVITRAKSEKIPDHILRLWKYGNEGSNGDGL